MLIESLARAPEFERTDASSSVQISECQVTSGQLDGRVRDTTRPEEDESTGAVCVIKNRAPALVVRRRLLLLLDCRRRRRRRRLGRAGNANRRRRRDNDKRQQRRPRNKPGSRGRRRQRSRRDRRLPVGPPRLPIVTKPIGSKTISDTRFEPLSDDDDDAPSRVAR